MSSTISTHLLICILVFMTSCCRSQEFVSRGGLKINSTNWYLNLNIKQLEENIQRTVSSLGNYNFGIDTYIEIGSPSYGQLIDYQLSEEGYSVYWNAEIITHVSQYFNINCEIWYGLSTKQCAKDISKVKLDKTSLGEMCLSMYYNKTACIGKNLKYRSPDGSCNNLKRFSLGKATTPYKRLLFPTYGHGVDEIYSYPPFQPPNPRTLSNELVNDEHSPDNFKTMAMAYWTIFIGHDLSHTAISGMMKRRQSVSCCKHNEIELSPRDRNALCMQIIIPGKDKFYNYGNLGTHTVPHRCMNYVRSVPAVRSDCTFGSREQMNQATHYLDGSMIYGSSAQRTWLLRSKSGGQLLSNMGFDNKNESDSLQPQYMPLEDTESNVCQHGSGTCYRAGDNRANGFPQLTVMHTLWMREHNRLAKLLSNVNPHWDDERVFQEAKKIVTASIQHITYAEWLPALLGENYTRSNGLELSMKKYSNAYNKTTDPSVSNSFATAILPFANSMLSDTLRIRVVPDGDGFSNQLILHSEQSHAHVHKLTECLYSEDRVINANLSLKKHYNQPTDVLMNYMDQLVRGLSTQNTQKVDMLFTQTITNYLYSAHPKNVYGMDIVSLDLQRSRDHGIQKYTRFRKYCGLTDINNIQDLSQIMVEGSSEKLMKQYKTWNDIELLIGALFEKHEDDSMVGPTMRCLIREQFIRTRIGDRYFYDLPNIFNEYQLTEIRKVTLARIFCDNSNNVTTMQKRVFLIPETVDLQPCNSQLIPKININHWSEMVDIIQN